MSINKWKIKILLFVSVIMTSIMNAQNKTSLNEQHQSLVKISSLTAVGNLEQLKIQLIKGLDNGLTINEIKEALVQLYAYCGFPRSLNAINTFKAVLEERKAKGINDAEGKKITVENNSPDKYEQGRKVLETLSKTPQSKPAPGFGEFAPRIDAFLKEHLFADIFASDVLSFQQRELVTISALASIEGLESQLKSHIGIGKNTGITEEQLIQAADIIENTINKTQANTIRINIGKAPSPIIDPEMMVRIAEIEVIPEYLEEYKMILKENAATSIKTEQGVIAIFPMSEQDSTTKMRIVEIYANKESYKKHLQTSHFQHYKTTTLKMIKSLKLVEMNAVDQEKMLEIFKKLK